MKSNQESGMMRWNGRALTISGVGLFTLVAAFGAIGCFFTSPDDCANKLVNCPAGMGGGTSSSSTGGGGTGGTPLQCTPSESKEPIADSCGVFVSSSLGADDMAADRGTRAKPFMTIGAALKKADVTRVYVCAESFTEAVTISTDVDLYGGLDCKSWMYVGAKKKTALTAPEDQIPLTLDNAAGSANVEDFTITAAASKAPGGSSIAVLANASTVSLTRCDLTSGDGMTGNDGDPGDPNGMAAAPGTAGNNGAAACNGTPIDGNPGGVAAANMCGGIDAVSVGGAGGKGSVTNGNPGDPGQTGALGAFGDGEPSVGAWSCAANGAGHGGDDGAPGTSGPGATGVGSLSATGYAGTNGKPGMPGAPGQGGGGGGGAKGGLVCPANGAGASGGSGGAGGCAGKPGAGGAAGGASIALVSHEATVTLTDCTLTAGSGGSGGKGGNLQAGGSGGKSGTGGLKASSGKDACDGGKGGAGGDGGAGGGGLGGHSLAVAFSGTPVAKLGKTMLIPGMKGIGGSGGSGTMTNAGANGVAAVEQKFP